MAGNTRWLASLLAVATVSVAEAAPALTRIEDRLYRADGSRFSGTLYIEWRSFESADRTAIPGSASTARVSDGVLRVSLAPTATASPRAWYRVRYSSNGKTDFTEYWDVPSSPTPLRVRDIRIPGPLAASSSEPVPPVNTAILINDVAGLRDELDHRAAKGDGYVPGRAAVVNSEGDLESAAGNAADCVHVDGSSGPCGGASEAAFVDAETPGGVVDGSNASFTLANPPAPETSVALFRNGLLLRAGVDFTLSGVTLTMVSGAEPQPGDVFQVWYRTGDGSGTLRFADAESPSGSIDGANATFTLSAAPAPASSLQLFRNGILLKAGVDYDLLNDAVRFRDGAIPQPGDTLNASYRY